MAKVCFTTKVLYVGGGLSMLWLVLYLYGIANKQAA